MKEPTEPFDDMFHSTIRGVGRARTDHQVSTRKLQFGLCRWRVAER